MDLYLCMGEMSRTLGATSRQLPNTSYASLTDILEMRGKFPTFLLAIIMKIMHRLLKTSGDMFYFQVEYDKDHFLSLQPHLDELVSHDCHSAPTWLSSTTLCATSSVTVLPSPPNCAGKHN